MKTGTEQTGTERGGLGRLPKLKAFSAWIGLFLMLFNLVNGPAMAFNSPSFMPDSEWQICHSVGPDASSQDQDHPAQPHSHEEGACCLSLCCSVATTPVGDIIPEPASSWQTLTFDAAQSSQIRPAPSLGGIARAPPITV